MSNQPEARSVSWTCLLTGEVFQLIPPPNYFCLPLPETVTTTIWTKQHCRRCGRDEDKNKLNDSFSRIIKTQPKTNCWEWSAIETNYATTNNYFLAQCSGCLHKHISVWCSHIFHRPSLIVLQPESCCCVSLNLRLRLYFTLASSYQAEMVTTACQHDIHMVRNCMRGDDELIIYTTSHYYFVSWKDIFYFHGEPIS